MRNVGLVLSLMVVFVASQVVLADTIVCDDVQDAYTTYYGTGGYAGSSGSESTMLVYGQSQRVYSFLQFDLSDLSGYSSDQIDSATMKLYCSYYETASGDNQGFNIRMVTSPQTESVYNDNSMASCPSFGDVVTSTSQTGTGYYYLDVTDAVKAWLDGTDNNGLLITPLANYEQKRVKFWTKETSYTNYRPTLSVETPEPASICLLGMGALGLLRRRK